MNTYMSIYGRAIAISIAITLLLPTLVSAQFPPRLKREAIDGTNGFVVQGTALGQFGEHVSSIGDVNGDGFDDLLSGGIGIDWYEDCYCEPAISMNYVIFGGPDVTGDGHWWIDEVIDGVRGFAIPEQFEDFGLAGGATAGDFNHDGVIDFLVGSPLATVWVWQDAGVCNVVFGDRELGMDGSLDLSTLSGTNGFNIYGSHALASVGALKAGIGDFNGDGHDDVAIADRLANPGGRVDAGQTFVIFGGPEVGTAGELDMADLHSGNSIVVNGIHPGDRIGKCVTSAGDVNGDGYADLIFGSTQSTPPAEAYVVYGGPNVGADGVLELSLLNGDNGFVIRGIDLPPGSDLGGDFVAGLGDINGDGYDDVAVNEYESIRNFWVNVVFGGPNVAPDGVVDTTALDGSNGFAIVDSLGETYRGVTQPMAAGDINVDGFADIAVVEGTQTWLIYGAPNTGSSGTVVASASELNGRHGFLLDFFARARSRAGDVNGDGIDDFVVASEFGRPPASPFDKGEISVIFGRRMGDVDLEADVDSDDFAYWSFCMTGPTDGTLITGCQVFDFDRDGQVDLADFTEFQRVFAR